MNDRDKDVAQETLRNRGPIRKELVTELSEGLSAKKLVTNSVKLSKVLRSDVFLYGLMYNGLWDTDVTVAQEEDDAIGQLETTSVDILQKLLPKDRVFPNHGPLDESKSVCIRFITVAAASASYLAARSDSNSAAAYSLTLLRNLPLCLLPWTYPGAFNKAVQAYLTQDKTLQKCVEESLRMSYSEYAQALYRNIPRHIKFSTVESGFATLVLPDIKAVQSETKRAVLIGEAIARVALSSIFHISRRDWVILKGLLAEHVGAHGISKIEEKIEDMVQGFVEHNPALGHRLELEEQAEFAIEGQKLRMANNNVEELNLNEDSIAEIKKFYKTVKPGEVDMDNVERLLVETTPALGFDASAVYIVEPNTGRLIARFRLTDYGNVVDKSVVITEAQMLQLVQT